MQNLTVNAATSLYALKTPNLIHFKADYITVVEDRPITSVQYCLPVPVFYFWRKL